MKFNIFNLNKQPKQRPHLRNEGLIIERLDDSYGQCNRRVRIEMNNSTFINLSNAMHVGRAAALSNAKEHKLTAQGNTWEPFNNRTNRQINSLRGLAMNIIREIKEHKKGATANKAVRLFESNEFID